MSKKSEPSLATNDLIKGQKRHFESIENQINGTMASELVGELGSKSCLILKKELQEARKMAIEYLSQFQKNMEIVDKKYNNIAALGDVLVDENSVFMLLRYDIEQDEIKENELKNQIIQANVKYKELQSLIASKKTKYHHTYDIKLCN
jgi:hypothetical protein